MSRMLITNKYLLSFKAYGAYVAKYRQNLGCHGRHLRHYRVFETTEAYQAIYHQSVQLNGDYG